MNLTEIEWDWMEWCKSRRAPLAGTARAGNEFIQPQFTLTLHSHCVNVWNEVKWMGLKNECRKGLISLHIVSFPLHSMKLNCEMNWNRVNQQYYNCTPLKGINQSAFIPSITALMWLNGKRLDWIEHGMPKEERMNSFNFGESTQRSRNQWMKSRIF